ncbi:hypothetical protein HO173_004197 [Letharia columbiana]|uniref:Uncharacterized protein n=1 Tax=Letharia columbiana TaxID=112416 RepID=A0A8H6G0D0_9LECA|nr:uncharacterized protein HO173_004197 [Letharia columbiana]KAF6237996.1 hypothetical protein HO173_004197 [Letharia columbiana]
MLTSNPRLCTIKANITSRTLASNLKASFQSAPASTTAITTWLSAAEERPRPAITAEIKVDIDWYAFNSNNSVYRTASRLYYSLDLPVNPGLKYLFGIAGRRGIDKQLVVASAAQLQKTHYWNSPDFQLPGKCFDEGSYGRFIRNVRFPCSHLPISSNATVMDSLAMYSTPAVRTLFGDPARKVNPPF